MYFCTWDRSAQAQLPAHPDTGRWLTTPGLVSHDLSLDQGDFPGALVAGPAADGGGRPRSGRSPSAQHKGQGCPIHQGE